MTATQLITWRPGGAQGAEMPEFAPGEDYRILAVTFESWAHYDELAVSDGILLDHCGKAYDEDGENFWAQVFWYIPCSELHPPEPTP